MTTYNRRCYCGQTNWTVRLEKEQQGYLLWYVYEGPHELRKMRHVPVVLLSGGAYSQSNCAQVGFECRKGKHVLW